MLRLTRHSVQSHKTETSYSKILHHVPLLEAQPLADNFCQSVKQLHQATQPRKNLAVPCWRVPKPRNLLASSSLEKSYLPKNKHQRGKGGWVVLGIITIARYYGIHWTQVWDSLDPSMGFIGPKYGTIYDYNYTWSYCFSEYLHRCHILCTWYCLKDCCFINTNDQ